MKYHVPMFAVALLLSPHAPAADVPPRALTLKEAQAIALENQPRIRAARLAVSEAQAATREVESAYYPLVSASVTAAGADSFTRDRNGVPTTIDTRIAAGGLNNPTVLSRESNGLMVDQLVTDFGRTRNLVDSSRYTSASREEQFNTERAQILLEVSQAYYRALEAQAIVKVASQTLDTRQLLLTRVTLLAQNKLKSELDVSFAKVNVEQARLLLVQAQNALEAAFANLSTSMGYRDTRSFQLADNATTTAPPADLAALLSRAIEARPELASLRADHNAALKFVKAERALNYPTVNLLAVAGVTPVGDSRLGDTYEAAGINVSVPIFNGGKYTAMEEQAKLKADSVNELLTDAENRVVRDVRIAWLDTKAGFESLDVTMHLKEYAAQALDLAQSRYNIGLSSIIDVTQAQLNETEAEIAYNRAKYEYQIQNTVLNFQIGNLR